MRESTSERYRKRIKDERLSWQWHTIFVTAELLLATLIAIRWLG